MRRFLSINFLHFRMFNDVLNCCNLYFLKESIPCIQITWQWLPFTNSARKDNLQLYHWVGLGNFWKCFHELCKRSFLMRGVVYGILILILIFFFFCASHAFQVRVVNGVPPTGDYSFAKYNKVLKFSLLFALFL